MICNNSYWNFWIINNFLY